eukprot:CAMPEP_0170607292 /NCGR_PEP_ID=MMETSP0224-20130122/20974_1 /TAXON_ID=285029 /ORGANISM="Togula jolla, Strain CCCM 725" /LENGTH=45 /DNA_ID= /DNA_START= /DNA_END= /DNA_ORIENTATION=
MTPRFDDHGDTIADATQITVGTAERGELEIGGDKDYFCVVLTSGP